MRRLTLSLLGALIPTMTLTAWAAPAERLPLAELVRQADLIVEGSVETIRPDADHNIPGYIGEAKNNVTLTVGQHRVLLLKPDQIYKGRLPSSTAVKIISTPATAEAFGEITATGRYILFLKKARGDEGFIITENGKGQFRVFDYNGVERVKTWFQRPQFRQPDAYRTYEEFRRQLMALTHRTP